jgi:5-methylcytosine-specific restriction endonuclease McrA
VGSRRTGNPRTKSASWVTRRRRIVERDGGICHICGGPGADSADHVIPLSQGGTDDDDNLAAVHHKVPPRCNIVRKNRTVEEARRRLGIGHPSRTPRRTSRRW